MRGGRRIYMKYGRICVNTAQMNCALPIFDTSTGVPPISFCRTIPKRCTNTHNGWRIMGLTACLCSVLFNQWWTEEMIEIRFWKCAEWMWIIWEDVFQHAQYFGVETPKWPSLIWRRFDASCRWFTHHTIGSVFASSGQPVLDIWGFGFENRFGESHQVLELLKWLQ